jgi:hypothetical protein
VIEEIRLAHDHRDPFRAKSILTEKKEDGTSPSQKTKLVLPIKNTGRIGNGESFDFESGAKTQGRGDFGFEVNMLGWTQIKKISGASFDSLDASPGDPFDPQYNNPAVGDVFVFKTSSNGHFVKAVVTEFSFGNYVALRYAIQTDGTADLSTRG